MNPPCAMRVLKIFVSHKPITKGVTLLELRTLNNQTDKTHYIKLNRNSLFLQTKRLVQIRLSPVFPIVLRPTARYDS